MTMTLISTVTLGSSGASIAFSSIPQTGTDLLLVVSLKNNSTGAVGFPTTMTLNSTSATASRVLLGNGASTSSNTGIAIGYDGGGLGQTANTFNSMQVYIHNYTGSTNKTVSSDSVTEGNFSADNSAYLNINALTYPVTTGVTALSIQIPSQTIAANSTASLYTITKGSGGATVS